MVKCVDSYMIVLCSFCKKLLRRFRATAAGEHYVAYLVGRVAQVAVWIACNCGAAGTRHADYVCI